MLSMMANVIIDYDHCSQLRDMVGPRDKLTRSNQYTYLQPPSDNNFWMKKKIKTHTLRTKKILCGRKSQFPQELQQFGGLKYNI